MYGRPFMPQDEFLRIIERRLLNAAPPPPFTPPAPPAPSITASIAPTSIPSIGATAQITVVNEHGVDVTSGCTFSSGATSVATVDATGLATAVANGSAPITVTHTATGLTTSVNAVVNQVVASATLSPADKRVARGDTQQFTAIALDATGHVISSPPTPTWQATSAKTGAAFGNVDSTGLWTAEAGALGDMTGTLVAIFPNGVVSGSSTLYVDTPTATSVSPNSFAAGSVNVAFTFTGTGFADDSVVTAAGLSGLTVVDYTRTDANTIAGHLSVSSGTPVGTASLSVSSVALGVTVSLSISITAAAGLAATPSSFSGAVGATQQESFAVGATDVTSDMIAYSLDPSIATITSAPEQPTVAAAVNPTASSLDVPVTGGTPYGGVPTQVALEVDENGTGSWVRQTAVAWTGAQSATQNVTASGLTAAKDYAGKIRAVTINASGDSYASGTIPSGTTSAAASIPAGLSGVGFFAEDFSSYASDSAVKSSSNLTFYTTSTTYGALDTTAGDKYNNHNTFSDISPTDGSSSGIGSKVPADTHERVTYRATIQWRSGVDYSLGRTLLGVRPKDGTLFLTGQYLTRLRVDSTGKYQLDMQLYNAASNSIMSGSGATLLGSAGAEITSGYTVDYFLRVEKIDTTHVKATVWLAKNVNGTVGTPMLLGSVTKTLTTAEATLAQGIFNPDSDGNSHQPHYAVSTAIGIAQFEAIDEVAHPDYYDLAAAAAYTPLT